LGIFDNSQIAVAFCSPNRKVRLPNGREVIEQIAVEWHRRRSSLSVGTNCNFIEFFCDGMEVGAAREAVVRRTLAHDPRPEFIFFLDNDVLPEFDAFVKLLYRARTFPGHDIFAGVYACKGLAEPLIYSGNGAGPYWDWAVGDLLTTEQHGITGVHSGLTLIRTSLYQRMLDEGIASDQTPFYLTVKEHGRSPSGAMQTRSGTEDLYFCQLAGKAGAKIMVDTSVLAGHYDKHTGITWGMPEDSPPAQRAKWLKGKDKEEAGDLKLALDLGAGGTRREWDGHRTYTTDLRADSKPDYVQDSRFLNLPDNHFDLVASSHHLEHIPRWEQETVWQQIFRVCKPGGRIEHIVPSVEWAAWKIVDGSMDEHVLNVLYGAQEQHGYARELNLHYFGYTAAIGKALAEAAGFVDVTTEDWRTEGKETLGYNLVIRGTKPEQGG